MGWGASVTGSSASCSRRNVRPSNDTTTRNSVILSEEAARNAVGAVMNLDSQDEMQNAECRMLNPEEAHRAVPLTGRSPPALSGFFILHSAFCIRPARAAAAIQERESGASLEGRTPSSLRSHAGAAATILHSASFSRAAF